MFFLISWTEKTKLYFLSRWIGSFYSSWIMGISVRHFWIAVVLQIWLHGRHEKDLQHTKKSHGNANVDRINCKPNHGCAILWSPRVLGSKKCPRYCCALLLYFWHVGQSNNGNKLILLPSNGRITWGCRLISTTKCTKDNIILWRL